MKIASHFSIFLLLLLIPVPVFGKTNYEKMIIVHSKVRAMDHNLLLAIVEAESNFRPSVVSHRGALGLCQITIPVAKDRLGYSQQDKSKDAEIRRKLLDPHENIHIALMHLAWIDKHLHASLEGAKRLRMIIAIYNAGYRIFINKTGRLPDIGEGVKSLEKPLEKWKKRERDHYIQKVLNAYQRFVKKYGHSQYSLLN